MNITTMAAELVMQDLIDCLLAEDFFGREPLPLLTASRVMAIKARWWFGNTPRV